MVAEAFGGGGSGEDGSNGNCSSGSGGGRNEHGLARQDTPNTTRQAEVGTRREAESRSTSKRAPDSEPTTYSKGRAKPKPSNLKTLNPNPLRP